ncbi:MAG: sugar phosphate nucleotidyltransferase, partial [bacterium]
EYATKDEDKKELESLFGYRNNEAFGFIKQFSFALYEFAVGEDGHTAKYARWEPIWHHSWEPAKLIESYEWKEAGQGEVDLANVDWENNPVIALPDGAEVRLTPYAQIPRAKPVAGSTFRAAVADEARQADLISKAEEVIRKQFTWDGQQLLLWPDILTATKDFEGFHRAWLEKNPSFNISSSSPLHPEADFGRVAVLILAAGIGSRLWPASRKGFPKQLRCFDDTGISMLQRTVDRVLPFTGSRERIFVSTTLQLQEQVREQLCGRIPIENILTMPVTRETSIGIGNAAVRIKKILATQSIRSPTLVVLPSDHVISQPDKFRAYLEEAVAVAQSGPHIVTLGIKPTHHSTEFGYIRRGDKLPIASNTHQGLGFSEKPPYPVRPQTPAEILKKHLEKYPAPDLLPTGLIAQELIQDGAVWNGGMFIYDLETILAAFRLHAPAISQGLEDIHQAIGSPNEEGVISEVFNRPSFVNAKSVDFVVMEHLSLDTPQALACVGAEDIGWNDVGNWDAFVEDPDADGNSIIQGKERILLQNTRRCIIFAYQGQQVELRDVRDLIVVCFPDASLVINRAETQAIKDIFKTLEDNPDPLLRKYVEEAIVSQPLPHTILLNSQDSRALSEYGILAAAGLINTQVIKKFSFSIIVSY